MKPYIREVIIVEGRDDTRRLNEVFDCETIETNGSAINKRTLDEIEVALNTRGAIIFTDPDYPGQKIRNTILERFPNIKEAFISRNKAKNKRGKIGVENASPEDLKDALKRVVTSAKTEVETITKSDMIDLQLSGQPDSKKRRHHVAEKLNIGYANANSMHQKFNRYNIQKELILDALKDYKE
ncbi:ribonuclease M5 [Nosocomiicoccus massiliensis]|uniref:Ribonuclease M5 n=1 Tax=Nosocomiicoccus massiliensis TaxID=1232430 RepID=A0AAF0YHC1_9STAP|nr:ribonuclease M5 [Nosocomiicoccus massiliensis]WOS95606.1 ribonuclease M5 [Nosocomiicoccus massiliensis]